MTRGHGWSLTITMQGTFTPYSLPAFTGAFDATLIFSDKAQSTIIIPAIVLMEVLYLFEKNRIDISLFQTEDLLKSQNYQFEPLSLQILKTASEITDIPELHDRLIAATARYLDLPLITNDPVIRASEFVDILE